MTTSTFQSAEQLLSHHLAGNLEPSELQLLKKQFVLDSFKVNRFHKKFKNWENSSTDEFVQNEITAYNSKLGELSRINYETEHLLREYKKFCEQIDLPSFQFARETLEQYENGRLLPETASESSAIALSDIFSLNVDGILPKPDIDTFRALLNIEFRLRIQRKIKYEILLIIKQQLTAKNKKWAARDSTLNEFMRKLENVTEEVDRIRKSEKEDLKEYDEDDDEEEDDEDEEMEQEEQEEQHGDYEEAGDEQGVGEEEEEEEDALVEPEHLEFSAGPEEARDPEDEETPEQIEEGNPPSSGTDDIQAADEDDDIMNIDG